MTYTLYYTKIAQKDAVKIKQAGLKSKTETLLALLEENPYQTPPFFEKLIGDLEGAYSRRISIQHRLIYCVNEKEKYVKVLRMWTHYE
jgi:Txe/YoeB family toxin of toxin-antitoxin system